MEALITIIIIAFVIYFIYKAAKPKDKTNHSEAPFDIKITTSTGGLSNSEIELEKFPSIEQDKNSYWILNPGAPFELTLMTKTLSENNIDRYKEYYLQDISVTEYIISCTSNGRKWSFYKMDIYDGKIEQLSIEITNEINPPYYFTY